MTMPGRAVRMVMRQRLAARSIKICGTDSVSSFFLSKVRISRSSVRSLPNSFLPAYHLERQSRVTAIRRPIGFVFCPILSVVIGQNDLHVAIPLQDRSSGTTGFRSKSAVSLGRLRHRFLHDQGVGVDALVVGAIRLQVLGVCHGGLEG